MGCWWYHIAFNAYQKIMAAIGKYYESTLAEFQRGSSQWILPAPTPAMDLLTLQAGIDKLNSQIQHWTDTLLGSTNSKEITNLDKIISLQETQLQQYKTELENRTVLTYPPEGQTGIQDPEPKPPTAAQGPNILPWLILAAGIILINKTVKP